MRVMRRMGMSGGDDRSEASFGRLISEAVLPHYRSLNAYPLIAPCDR